MKVSFTGVRNVSYYSVTNKEQNVEDRFMSLELTDDAHGSYLTDYKELLKYNKNLYAGFENPVDKNFINILEIKNLKTGKDKVYVNNQYLSPAKENRKMFRLLECVTDFISRYPIDEYFVCTTDYKNSKKINKAILLGQDMGKKIPDKEEYDSFMSDIHDIDNIRDGAAVMNADIKKKYDFYR